MLLAVVGVTSFGVVLLLPEVPELFGVLPLLVVFVLLVISSPMASVLPAFLSGVEVTVVGGVWVEFKGLLTDPVAVRGCSSGTIGVLGLVKTPIPAPCSLLGVVLLGMVGDDVLLVYSGAFGSVLPC